MTMPTPLIKIIKSDCKEKIELIKSLISSGEDIFTPIEIPSENKIITAMSEAYAETIESQEKYHDSLLKGRPPISSDPFVNLLNDIMVPDPPEIQERKQQCEVAVSVFNLLLENAKMYVCKKIIRIMSKDKLNRIELEVKIKEMILALAGKNSIAKPCGDSEKQKKNYEDLQKKLLTSIFEPVLKMILERDSFNFIICCGEHERLGRDSGLTFLFRNPLYDSKLRSIILEHIILDVGNPRVSSISR